MYIGIDVGGTNTDGVLIDNNFSVVKSIKTESKKNIIESLTTTLNFLLENIQKKNIKQITISSTLALNELLQKEKPIALIITSGPGLNPNLDFFNKDNKWAYIAKGWQDHRGQVLVNIDESEIINILQKLISLKAESIVIASKFSPKNNILEEKIETIIKKYLKKNNILINIYKASTVTSQLNFLSRINTAYFNASIQKTYLNFLNNINIMIKKFKLNVPIYILKADGGNLKLENAKKESIKTIMSGPAASLMGLWALNNNKKENILMLDIGGSTTDLAILSKKGPLLSSNSLTIQKQKTLIRSLLTTSIPLGGDCILTNEDDIILPQRLGPAICLKTEDLNKRPPTLTDALNILNLNSIGDLKASQNSLKKYFPNENLEKLSLKILNKAVEKIDEAIFNFLKEINEKPRYTVNEILLTEKIKIDKIFILGTPATFFKKAIEEKTKIPTIVPAEAGYTNAIGAALSQENTEIELLADTQIGLMTIPELNIKKTITNTYTAQQAEKDLQNVFKNINNFQIFNKIIFNKIDDYGNKNYLIRISGGQKTTLLSFINKDFKNV